MTKEYPTSPLEAALLQQIRAAGLPEPVLQHRFAKGLKRQWPFDFAFPEQKVAVEVEGGGFVRGAHSTGQGSENDAVKAAVALLLGWRVVTVTTHMVEDWRAIALIRAVVTGEMWDAVAIDLATIRCKKCDLTRRRRNQKVRQKAKEAAGAVDP